MRQGIIGLAMITALAACGAPKYATLSDVQLDETMPRAEMRADAESQGGLLSGLFGARRGAAAAEPAAPTPVEPAVETAAMAPDAEGPNRSAPSSGGGFLGGLFSGGGKVKPGDVDYAEVGPGVLLPYGQMARLCGVPVRKLGREVARSDDGRGGYRIYDSTPGSTGLRSFFVTGFDDGCARQISASLALFATPLMHEQLRYGLPAKVQPYSETDDAYEVLKSRECRTRRGQPCGSRIDRLNRSTAFITLYERFGGAGRWSNILLHDGEVLAKDVING